ncbi:MAG TPA: tetratricopeptide repeat protein [Pyrinomonadaceae bacterium]|jgi:tetratricopeptide (TPR) repeat protein|nr:tetratricopeptide repeat protein [Pyrinomonadaceae bacterium]
MVCVLSAAAFSQAPKAKPTPKKPVTKPAASPTPAESEDEVFEKVRNIAAPAERAPALKEFLEKFPESAHKVRAQELLVSARAQEAEGKIQAGDTPGGIALFELAVREAPSPLSDQLFHGVMFLIPNNLQYLGQNGNAIKIADLIEEKVGNNFAQLLDLAKFHLSVENASGAQRAAEKATAIDSGSAAGYEILGQAYRMNLKLEEAAAAYEKGLQTNTRLLSTILYLADSKRALGKPEEALALYKEALEREPDNTSARSGMVLALLNSGKRREAEVELQNALAANQKNFVLMAGVAYWYAAHNEGDKAVELARRALTVEPRFVWAHIALARGLLLQKQPVEAERVMLQASQYGNFPTISYERASAKYAVGFFEEAAIDLRRSFSIKDGKLAVDLAGRIPQSGDSFVDILAPERRASIYESLAADSPENAARLKTLLVFDLKLSDKDAADADIVAAADAFVGEKDAMQSYRQLYVANKLLQKKRLPEKTLQYVQSAVGGIDNSVTLPNATLAVLADELLEPRASALTRGTAVDVPAIPKPVLLSIMRGRVEELSGWALFQQEKLDEAVVRLRRAVSVLPEQSTWWRSTLWKLATILDATGKSDEAFEAYSRSYLSGPPDTIKYATLQGLCQRLYGGLNGCEEKITLAAKGDPSVKKGAGSLLKAQPTPVPPVSEAPKPVETSETIKNTGGAAEPSPSPTMEPVSLKTSPNTSPNTSSAPEVVPPANTADTAAPQKTVTDESLKSEPVKEAAKVTSDEAKQETAPKTEETAKNEGAAKNDSESRKRTVTSKTEPEAAKDGVVYSNPNAQVRVRSLSSENTSGSSNTSGCQTAVSPEKLILINNGGWGSVTIDLKGDGKLEDIKVTTENSEDLTLELQTGIGKDIGRVLYVVRSISTKKGDFKVFVESPCGEKKEVSITVR